MSINIQSYSKHDFICSCLANECVIIYFVLTLRMPLISNKRIKNPLGTMEGCSKELVHSALESALPPLISEQGACYKA